MIDISDEIKQLYNQSTRQVDKILLNNKEYRISNVEYYDDVYNDGNIFGTAIAKCLEFEIENDVDLEGQEIEYFTGIIDNEVTNWIGLGKFIIQDVSPNDTTNIAKVMAMDYMLKFNIPYATKLDYSTGEVTILQVLEEVCSNSKVTLSTTAFANSNFIVDSNQFSDNTLNKQVIQAVAQIAGAVAKIRENQLCLIGPGKSISKIFEINDYSEAEIKRSTHPINVVSLGMTDVEGENITLRDEESVAKNGENILAINDNPFAYTQEKREQLITAIFEEVNGFEYKAFSFKNCQGTPYLETMDKIQFVDKARNIYDSYILRFNYKSPKGLMSTTEAPSIIKATVAYQNVPSALDVAKRAEYKVDKFEGKINLAVELSEEASAKATELELTSSEISSRVSETETLLVKDYMTKEEAATQYSQLSDSFKFNINNTIEELKEEGASKVMTTSVTVDDEGVTVGKSDSGFTNTMNNTGTYQYNAGELIAKYDKDGAEIPRLKSDYAVISDLKYVKEIIDGVVHHRTYVLE